MGIQNITSLEEAAGLRTHETEPQIPVDADKSTGGSKYTAQEQPEATCINPEKDGDAIRPRECHFEQLPLKTVVPAIWDA